MRHFLFSLLVLSQGSFASTEVVTKIFGIEIHEDKANVLSLADGRVYSLDTAKADMLAVLNVAVLTKVPVRMVLSNDGDSIESIHVISDLNTVDTAYSHWLLESDAETSALDSVRERRLADYLPTTVKGMAAAQDLFDSVYQYKEEDGNDLDDNCFNRAHFWARMMYIQNKVKSQKVFIFFTDKYRKDNNYKWWYHVAPFVLVGSTQKEVVLDMSFESEPITMKQWEKDFADKAKKSCYNGDSLSDYYAKTNTEDCVLVRASMYHYTPTDLEYNGSVTQWECADLKSVMRSIPGPDKKPWSKVEGFLPRNCN